MKTKPKIGALPTLNMPKRSHNTTKAAARPSRSVVNVNPITESSKKILPKSIVKSIGTLSICPGVKPFELSSSILHHVIPKSVDP